MVVDIGAEAIDRGSNFASSWTLINKDKPASVTGEITSIDIRAETNIAGLRVGTFYVVSGNTLKCRDSEIIAGTIIAGSKVTKAGSISVEVGDYIGLYYTSGAVERDLTGYAGLWYISGEYIGSGDQTTYTFFDGDAISLGGYTSEVVPLASKTFQSIWHVRELVNDTINYKWHVSAIVLTLVSNTLQLVFNVRALVSKTSQLKWRVLKLVDKSLQSIWNVRSLVNDTLELKWHVAALLVSKALELQWHVAVLLDLVSNILELQWYNLLRILRIKSTISRSLTITCSQKRGLKITSTLGEN